MEFQGKIIFKVLKNNLDNDSDSIVCENFSGDLFKIERNLIDPVLEGRNNPFIRFDFDNNIVSLPREDADTWQSAIECLNEQ